MGTRGEGVCTVLLEAGARPTNAALVLAIKGRHMAIAMALIESIRSSAQSPVESNTLVVALENCDERWLMPYDRTGRQKYRDAYRCSYCRLCDRALRG